MTERVTPNSLVTLHYRIASADNVDMVSTFAATPATLQLGSGELAPTLERCLDGLEVGAHRTFVLPAEQAFGARNPRMVSRVPRDALPPHVEPRLHDMIELPAADGSKYAGQVLELDEVSALMDFNHPLAGKPIQFEVKIVGVL